MKTLPVFVLALVATASTTALAAPVASACMDDHCILVQPPADPEIDQLLSQATTLETTAASNETSAMSLEKQADALTARARSLRSLASQIDDPGKSEMLVEAAGIDAQASSARSRGTQLRRRATDLRASARKLRQIAEERREGHTPRPVAGGPPVAVPLAS